MDALHATLADSAVYVRYLRKRVLELELEQSRSAARSLLGQWDATPQPAASEGEELSIEPLGHCWGRAMPRLSPSWSRQLLSRAFQPFPSDQVITARFTPVCNCCISHVA